MQLQTVLGMARQVLRKPWEDFQPDAAFKPADLSGELLLRSTIPQFGKGVGAQCWWLNEIHRKVGVEIQVLRPCGCIDTLSMSG